MGKHDPTWQNPALAAALARFHHVHERKMRARRRWSGHSDDRREPERGAREADKPLPEFSPYRK